MATILFIDTCASESLIGLLENGKWVQTKTLPDARRLGEMLHTEVADLLQISGKNWQHISAVAVVSGPGSYTGLRIGMAAAKGWCFALHIPLIALNRLELLLLQARKNSAVSGNVALLLPARVGEWFVLGANASGNLLFPAQHMTEEDWRIACMQWHFEKIFLAGAPTEKPLNFLAESVFSIENKVAILGLESLLAEKYQKEVFTDLKIARPEYLKGAYIVS